MEGRDRGSQRASFTSRYATDNNTQIGWFRLMAEIVSNRYDFVLYELFDLEPVKRFECTNDEAQIFVQRELVRSVVQWAKKENP